MEDGASATRKCLANVDQQSIYQNLASPSESTSEKLTPTYQNVDDRQPKAKPAKIHSRPEQLRHDHGELTEKCRVEQTEHERLVKQFEELLQENKKLKAQCEALESEKEKLADLWSSQANEHDKLKQENKILQSEYDKLKLEIEQGNLNNLAVFSL